MASNKACAKWCNKWTAEQEPCKECTSCTDMGCYFPQPLPAGIEDNPNAGFNVHYGSVDAPEDGTIELRGNTRAYLVADRHNQHSEYQHIDMRGKTLSFTADMSKVPCSVNAALYFVQMDGYHPDGYCDIQTENSCTEIDVFEANVRAPCMRVHSRKPLRASLSLAGWRHPGDGPHASGLGRRRHVQPVGLRRQLG